MPRNNTRVLPKTMAKSTVIAAHMLPDTGQILGWDVVREKLATSAFRVGCQVTRTKERLGRSVMMVRGEGSRHGGRRRREHRGKQDVIRSKLEELVG